MPLIERKIEIVLAYGTGADGLGTPQASTLSGHRVSVNCSLKGSAGLGQATVRIFGLSLSTMNQLSTVGKLPSHFRKNTITINAGDDVNGMAQIFQGTIIAAYADMLPAPEVAFNIDAGAGLIEALLPIPPSSYPGSADVAVILTNLAGQMSLPGQPPISFENNGVSVILATPYFPGSARAQAEAVVEAARIEWNGIENGVLAIWPRGGARGGLIPLLSPETGMVGYPTYTSNGLVVTTRFNPTVRFGAQVKVQSSLLPACGTWNVVTLVHDIEASMPNGKWFTQIQLGAPGYVAIPK